MNSSIPQSQSEGPGVSDTQTDFDTFLLGLSSLFTNLPFEMLDNAIEEVQRQICEYFKIDVCTLWQVSSDNPHTQFLTHYHAPSDFVLPSTMDAQKEAPWTLAKMRKGERLIMSRLADLPTEASGNLSLYQRLGIKSVLTFPLSVGGGETFGALNFTMLRKERHWSPVVQNQLQLVAHRFANALTRARTEQLVRFETLLSSISAELIAAGSERIEESVNSALDTVRHFFGVDRCVLLTVCSNLEIVNVAYASHAQEVSQVSSDINLVALFPWIWKQVVVDRKPLIVTRLDDLPPEASTDRASCGALGIVSFMNIPIENASKRLHLMVLNAVHKERMWPREYLSRLRLLGEILVNSLAREKASYDARQQAARVATAVDAAELGFAERTATMESPCIDDRLCEILGIDAADFNRVQELWDGRMDVESRRTATENRRRLLAGEIERAVLEYRYDHPHRGPIWLRHSWRRVESDQRLSTRIIEAVEDVTERRQALEDLQRMREKLERENIYLQQEVKTLFKHAEIVGDSRIMKEVLAHAEQVSATETTVLILGETGTGKELLTRAIHSMSSRKDRPLIAVNCSALPPTLIESELFGREKGAYTGSMTKMIGRFELADGSTLFLDEIGDLPLEVQSKLLRVLERGEFERLGSPRTMRVNIRLIAATNRDLERDIQEGKFRKDLYYRLNVFPIRVPPLRERSEDIPALVWSFVKQFEKSLGRSIQRIPAERMEALKEYSWPGNIRELRNVIERAMIISRGPVLDVQPPADGKQQNGTSFLFEDMERKHILEVLKKTNWKISGENGAAELLGLKRTTLQSKMKALGINKSVS